MAYVDQGNSTSSSSGDERLMDQLLLRASDWSLACDNALLNKLQELSDNLVRSSEKIVNDCDELMSDVDNLQFKVTNVTNEFLLLANTHFVENAVEEFKEFDVDPKQPTKPIQAPTKAEKEALLIDKMKEAIQVGVRTQQDREIERLRRSEELCHGSGESSHGLNLGYIIGSSKFFSSKYCGLQADRKYQIAKNTNSCISSETSNSTNSGFDDSLPSSNPNTLTFPDFASDKLEEKNSSSALPTSYGFTGYETGVSLFATPKPSSLAPTSEDTPEPILSNVTEKLSPNPQVNVRTPIPAPFSYIPVPARPPSTPSLSSADSSPTDLAPRLSSGFSPSDDIFEEVVSPTIPTKLLPQTVESEVQEDLVDEIPIQSPPPKAVHKFLDAAVISQLEKRLQFPKAPILVKEFVNDQVETPTAREDPAPPVSTANVKQVGPSLPRKEAIVQPKQSTQKPVKLTAQISREVIPPSLPSPLFKAPIAEPPTLTVVKPTAAHNSIETERFQPPPVAEVKKSIFDSDSDDDDDLLFSSKPLKASVILPKTSIFASLDTSKANDDLFRPPPILDMSDSEEDSDIFNITKSVEKSVSSNNRSIFSDLSVEVEPKEVFRKKTNTSSADSFSVSALPNESMNEANQSIIAPSVIGVAGILLDESFPEVSIADELSGSTFTVEPKEETNSVLLVAEESVPESNNPEDSVSPSTTDNLFKEDFVAPPSIDRLQRQSPGRLSSEDSADIFEDIDQPIPLNLPEDVLVTLTVPPVSASVDTHVEQVRATASSPPKFVATAESTDFSIDSKQEDADTDDDDDIFKDPSLVYSRTPLLSSGSAQRPQPPPVTIERSSKIKHDIGGKSIFDDTDSDDDLFPAKQPVSELFSTKLPAVETIDPLSTQKGDTIGVISEAVSPAITPAVIPELPKTVTEGTKKFVKGVSLLPPMSNLKNTTNATCSENELLTPAASTSQVSFNPETATTQKLPSTSSAIKTKSLFDSSDSDEGDLFSPKANFRRPSPTQFVTDLPTTSRLSTKARSIQQKLLALESKRKATLFDDSDNDIDDLFKKPKSSVIGSESGKAELSPSVQGSVVVSSTGIKVTDGIGKEDDTSSENKSSETQKPLQTKPNTVKMFGAVVQNLDSIFSAKLNNGKQIKSSQKHELDQSIKDPVPKNVLFEDDAWDNKDNIFTRPLPIANPLFAPGEPGTSMNAADFETSPNLKNLLPCLTKSRPKLTSKRRPPKIRARSQKASEENFEEPEVDSQESDYQLNNN